MDATTFHVCRRLSASDISDVFALAARSAAHDGPWPLSEHVTLHLRYGGDENVRHILAWASGELVGYAHLDVTDEIEGPSAELTVDPQWRRMGIGAGLVDALIAESVGGRLRLWAHGVQDSAGALAKSKGFQRSRVLWQMRRSLFAPLEPVNLPEDVTIRPFLPGIDDTAWVELNAKAFVDLPDQGGWTIDDLHRRMCEPWFDPKGFLVAVRDGALIGFHWTKVHGHQHNDSDADHHHDPAIPGDGHDRIGEVYVVGVDPAVRGIGLGKSLTIAGLVHLRSLGLSSVLLYVDTANETAIHLYGELGFAHWDTDVLYRR